MPTNKEYEERRAEFLARLKEINGKEDRIKQIIQGLSVDMEYRLPDGDYVIKIYGFGYVQYFSRLPTEALIAKDLIIESKYEVEYCKRILAQKIERILHKK